MRRGLLAASLLVMLLIAWTAALCAPPQRVSFQTADGVTIAATWHEASHGPAPAVILVHMLNRSRRDLEGLASRLSSMGIGALAIDLRGHGESRFGMAPAGGSYTAMLRDVQAAQRFLASRYDVQQSRIGILGASLGANLAALAAADGGLASVALLSPSLDYRGLRIEASARKYAGPMLLVVSDDDPYARRSAVELQKSGPGRELLTLSGAGHGTNMLSRAPELHHQLVDWFRRTLQ